MNSDYIYSILLTMFFCVACSCLFFRCNKNNKVEIRKIINLDCYYVLEFEEFDEACTKLLIVDKEGDKLNVDQMKQGNLIDVSMIAVPLIKLNNKVSKILLDENVIWDIEKKDLCKLELFQIDKLENKIIDKTPFPFDLTYEVFY